jgi:hypothetical protein
MNIGHFFLNHLGRKQAQLLAYIQSLLGKSKQLIRFGQITWHYATCQIQLYKVKLRF